MFRWWEITWFRTFFTVDIYLKGGNVIHFPKGYFSKFNVNRTADGAISEIKWVTRGFGIPMKLDVSEIQAIITTQ